MVFGCYTAKGEYGECVEIRSCPTMLEILKNKYWQPEIKKYLRESRCNVPVSSSKEVIICCPLYSSSSSYTTLAPNSQNYDLLPTNCGQDTMDKIVGGEVADIDEFPWMVLLEYLTR